MATRTCSRSSSREGGFTLIELIIAMGVMLVVSGLMLQGMSDMSRMNRDQANRSEMHAGIRNATALLQQEVGQAGRLAFPAPVITTGAIAPGTSWVSVGPSVTNMFTGVNLVIDSGANEEIVTVTGVNTATNQIQAAFINSHPTNVAVRPAGGFAAGVIPTTMANGSSATVLKILGDVNSNGTLVYVEYTCDWVLGRLSRNMMPHTAGAKPALTVEQILLDNMLPNPPDPSGVVPPCFSYQEQTISGRTYVTNVAIMTTVRTQDRDQVTGQFQVVTKALLNVAPRNVFHTWQIAGLGYTNRIQPLPPSVLNLLN
jgi:prepilin-type N-terminal cleavage/methylation domain-containing protein